MLSILLLLAFSEKFKSTSTSTSTSTKESKTAARHGNGITPEKARAQNLTLGAREEKTVRQIGGGRAMSMSHGLSPETVMRVGDLLAQFPEVQSATLFGSRAKGTHHPGSDIDLALVGKSLDWRILGRIENALDDLLLPYRFSLIRFGENTDPELNAHIQRVGQPFYERASMARTSLEK